MVLLFLFSLTLGKGEVWDLLVTGLVTACTLGVGEIDLRELCLEGGLWLLPMGGDFWVGELLGVFCPMALLFDAFCPIEFRLGSFAAWLLVLETL